MKVLSATFDMQSKRINLVTDPSLAQDAATKNYVDGRFDPASDNAFTAAQTFILNDANTGVSYLLTISHDTSGTPFGNTGAGILFKAETLSVADQNQADIHGGWVDATDATRTGYIELRAVLNGTLMTIGTGLKLWGSKGLTLNRTVDPGSGNLDISGVYMTAGTQITPADLLAEAGTGSAAAGKIGQFVGSTISTAGAMTANVVKNITSISLTAGDWEVRGCVTIIATNIAAGGIEIGSANISTTSATITADGEDAANNASNPTAAAQTLTYSIQLPPRRISLGATTTVYLCGKSGGNAASRTGYGYIEARRVR